MICDGGKIGCALKLYNATISACLSAKLATEGVVVPADNGIIHENIEQTIINMGELSYPGMENRSSNFANYVKQQNKGYT